MNSAAQMGVCERSCCPGFGWRELRSEPVGEVALFVSEKMVGKNAEPRLKNSSRIGFKLVPLPSRDLKDRGGWLSGWEGRSWSW